MNVKEIEDILKTADSHLILLKSLEKQLHKAVDQIFETEEKTVQEIKNKFSDLKEKIISILNYREECLLKQTTKIKDQGLSPLRECQKFILKEIESTEKVITIGKNVKLNNGGSNDLDEFTKNARLLGRLPEVPELKDVPYISFCYEQCTEKAIENVLKNFGNIFAYSPVQIVECTEQPGAIMVEWQHVSCDDRLDIQEFKLERAFGDVIQDQHLLVNFKTCYQGVDTQYLVKDLLPFQVYSFRICCKFEGSSQWSPWSLPQVCSTNLKPFCWKLSDDCVLSMENTIAEPIKKEVVICSDGAQFSAGNSIEFTLLEVDSNKAIIGLIQGDFSNDLTEAQYSFLLNQDGKIFIDGCEKLTVLPKFIKGLKVSFSSELVNEDKIRINIDSDNKRVTYDWSIDTESKMYFGAQFHSVKWKILVE